MAAPSIAWEAIGKQVTDTASPITITLPAATAGEKVVLLFCHDGFSDTVEFSADFRQVAANNEGSSYRVVIAECDVDGSEAWAASGGSITATVSSAQEAIWSVAKLSGNPGPLFVKFNHGAAVQSIDAPACSFPKADARIIAASFGDTGDLIIDGYPAGYSNTANDNTGGAGGVSMARCDTSVTAAQSADPGSFTQNDASEEMVGVTIAIPALPVSGGAILKRRHVISNRNVAPAAIDLTARGIKDWIHFGRTAIGDVARKNGGRLFNALSKIGTFTETRFDAGAANWPDVGWEDNSGDGPAALSWEDGALACYDDDCGFRLTTNALGQERVKITVIWAPYSTSYDFDVSVSDGSSTAVDESGTAGTSETVAHLTEIVVEPSSPTATLQIDITKRADNGASFQNVAIMGAFIEPWPFELAVEDTFTDTNGTGIEAHSPDIDLEGGGYSAEGATSGSADPTGSGSMDIQGNQLQLSASSEVAILEVGSPDVVIEADLPISGTSGHRYNVPLRRIDKGNVHWINLREPNADYNYYAEDGFSQTNLLGGAQPFTYGTNTTWQLDARMIGLEMSHRMDGYLVRSHTEPTNRFPTATKAGIGVAGIGTDVHYDNLRIWRPISTVTHALEGSASAAAAANADLTKEVQLGGSAVAQAAASASLTVESALSAVAVGQAAATAALSVAKPLLSLAVASPTAAADISLQVSLEGLAAGSAAATAELGRSVGLSGAASGTSSASGVLGVEKALEAAAAAVAAATALLNVSSSLPTSIATAQASASGALAVEKPLAGVAAGESSAVADISLERSLDGVAAAQAEATAELGVDKTLEASAQVSAQASGSLTVSSSLPSALGAASASASADLSVEKPLEALAAAESSATAALSLAVPLAGAAPALASAAAALGVEKPLEGATSAQASGDAVLGVEKALEGSANAEAAASGLATAIWYLQGLAASESTATGEIQLEKPLAGIGSAAAEGSAELGKVVPLDGAASAEPSASASITTDASLAGVAASTASASALLTVEKSMAGTAATAAAATAQMSKEVSIAGSAAAEAAGTAVMSNVVPLFGMAAGEAQGSALVTAERALRGLALAEASGVADIRLEKPLAGSSQAEAAATGSMQSTVGLSGAASASPGASAALGVHKALAGLAAAQAAIQAELGLVVQLSGAAIAQSSAYASPVFETLLSGLAAAEASGVAVVTKTGPPGPVVIGSVNVEHAAIGSVAVDGFDIVVVGVA